MDFKFTSFNKYRTAGTRATAVLVWLLIYKLFKVRMMVGQAAAFWLRF